MTFDDLILDIIRENSGGIKMTELIVKVLSWIKERPCSEDPNHISGVHAEDFPQVLFDKISELEAAGIIGVLKYGSPMCQEVVREKQFIYFPLEDE